MVTEEDDPLWKKIFLNELFLVFVAAVVILTVAFALATRKGPDDKKPARGPKTVDR